MGPVGLGLAIADRIVQGAAPRGGAIKTDDKAQAGGFSDVLLDVANSTARSVRLGGNAPVHRPRLARWDSVGRVPSPGT